MSVSSSADLLSNQTIEALPHQLFLGTTWHSRLLPSVHKFAYPYRYWGVNISALAAGKALPDVGVSALSKHKLSKRSWLRELPSIELLLFSTNHKALQQFYAHDYLKDPSDTNTAATHDEAEEQTPAQELLQRLRQVLIAKTGSAPIGDIMGLVVCRNAGVYFSPVNFYIGFDDEQLPSHLLAEVSNTPWNKRHYYGFLLDGADTEFRHDKDFHVSPFNPIDQQYHWQVSIKNKIDSQSDHGLQVRIAIDISDARGEVLKTGVKMSGMPMTTQSIQQSLRKNPLMNMTSLTRIYWHALKLYAIKKVPYINYDETLADSHQHKASSTVNSKK